MIWMYVNEPCQFVWSTCIEYSVDCFSCFQQNYYDVDDITITNRSFYDSELDARSETPTNNNSEPSTPIDENQVLPGNSLTRENISACIEEFSKMWGPAEKPSGNDHINNNRPNDKFDTIQTKRSDSFRWTDFKRNGEVRTTVAKMESLTLEIDPNAWDLPAPSNPSTDRNKSNSAIPNTTSPLNAPGVTSPNDGNNVKQENIELISSLNDRNDTDEEDNQSTYDLIHLMLEPHLRPVSPLPNDQMSKDTFEEHKRLAKEYFKVNSN